MAVYHTTAGEKYLYKFGDKYWRNSEGILIEDLATDNLPVPQLYSEEGTPTHEGYFNCKIHCLTTDLVHELKLHSVDEMIMKCTSLYPGVDMTIGQKAELQEALNLTEDEADSLAEMIPYAINEGFELSGDRYEYDSYEFGTKPKLFDWEIL
ncbi:hypothetical protein [Vibrio sp. 10N.239.312.D08]|uniref:hypothetical protein n=1 Tax=Vibrio sp. 10N.239.312.D08 TaxID=3229978 RepID=UPI00354EAAEE